MTREQLRAAHRGFATIDAAFQRLQYAGVARDVKAHDSEIRLRDAWVYHFHGDHWEFHYKDYYWHGSAGGAFEARAAGWSHYLAAKGVPGYAND